MRHKGLRSISRLTLAGAVVLERRRYARADGSSLVPVDSLIDQADRTVSLGVRQLGCRLSLDAHSFERAAANLQAAAHLILSVESLRQLVQGEGKLAVRAQNHEQLEFDWEAKDCLTARPDGRQVSRAYLSCDGVMVPVVTQAEKDKRRHKAVQRRRRLRGQCQQDQPEENRAFKPLAPRRSGADQKYKEIKIVTIYDQERQHWAVRATRQNHCYAGRLMRRLAGAVRLKDAQEKTALIDGACWIASQTRHNVPCLDSVTLDFNHLSQHVHEVRVRVLGEHNPAGWAWVEKALHAAKHEGYQPFWEELVALRAKVRSPSKRASIDALMNYAAERREMMSYPQHLERGWDLGSGPVESMCKAMTERLKGRGMRWDADNAEAMMALEALMQSNQWLQWWENRYCSIN